MTETNGRVVNEQTGEILNGDVSAMNFYTKNSFDPGIIQKLDQAKQAMGPLIKDARNPHFKNTYATLEAVFDVVEGPLREAGLLIYQGADGRYEGNQYVVVVKSYLVEIETGRYIGDELPMPVAKSDPQGVGAAITYGRRYLLVSQCGLTPEDDDGNAASNVGGNSRNGNQSRGSSQNGNQSRGNSQNGNNRGNGAGKKEKDDVDFYKITPEQTPELVALAKQVYGSEAVSRMKAIIEATTNGRVKESSGLSKDEAQRIIDGLKKKAAETVQDDSAGDTPQPATAAQDNGERPAWRNPTDAQEWAHQQGAYASTEEAREDWKSMVVDHFGGSLKGGQLPEAYDRFYQVVNGQKTAA